MPRINSLSLDQINRQLDTLDNLQKQVRDLKVRSDYVAHHISVADPIHAPQTTNNFIITWTGGTQLLSWPQAFVKDKNWNAQTLANPEIRSSAKGLSHTYTIPAGNASAAPQTYYWLGWDPVHQVMLVTRDVSALHGNYLVQIICQVYTGTAGQTGVAGGGGSNGGVEFSGAKYKNPAFT